MLSHWVHWVCSVWRVPLKCDGRPAWDWNPCFTGFRRCCGKVESPGMLFCLLRRTAAFCLFSVVTDVWWPTTSVRHTSVWENVINKALRETVQNPHLAPQPYCIPHHRGSRQMCSTAGKWSGDSQHIQCFHGPFLITAVSYHSEQRTRRLPHLLVFKWTLEKRDSGQPAEFHPEASAASNSTCLWIGTFVKRTSTGKIHSDFSAIQYLCFVP